VVSKTSSLIELKYVAFHSVTSCHTVGDGDKETVPQPPSAELTADPRPSLTWLWPKCFCFLQ